MTIVHRFAMTSSYAAAILSSSLPFLIRIVSAVFWPSAAPPYATTSPSPIRHDDFRHDQFAPTRHPIQCISFLIHMSMTSAELCFLAPPSPIRHDQPLTDSPRPALQTRQDQLTDSGSIYFVLSSHAFAVTSPSPIRHDRRCPFPLD